MSAATGLEVDQVGRANADGADAPAAARWLHRHALDQRRIGVEFFVRDGADADRVRRGHQRGNARIQRLLVQRLGHVEVQPCVLGRDGAAVDQLRHQVTQQMGGGVKTHQLVSPVPVDARRQRVAHRDSSGPSLLRI